MTDTATAAATFGGLTTTRDESKAGAPDEALPREPAPDEKPERAREIVFQLSGVEVRYSGVTAVQDVNVDIAANEITAFIGPSGCGKTTVLRSLNRMHDITPGAEVLGKVTYHGEDLYASKVDPAEVRRRVGMVFQAVAPDVILMDEPCSALDPIATARIEDLMDELKNLYTIVIVTHNMQQAARVSDRTAFFTAEVDDAGHRRGRLIEYDVTETIFTTPSDPRTEGYITGRFG